MCVAVLALIVNIIKQKKRPRLGRYKCSKSGGQNWHRCARPYSYATICKRNVCILTDLFGSVHFWCNFLGTKKVYKIENQIFVDYSLRRALDSNGVAIEPMPLKKSSDACVEQ